jgi:hypothetical protein
VAPLASWSNRAAFSSIRWGPTFHLLQRCLPFRCSANCAIDRSPSFQRPRARLRYIEDLRSSRAGSASTDRKSGFLRSQAQLRPIEIRLPSIAGSHWMARRRSRNELEPRLPWTAPRSPSHGVPTLSCAPHPNPRFLKPPPCLRPLACCRNGYGGTPDVKERVFNRVRSLEGVCSPVDQGVCTPPRERR